MRFLLMIGALAGTFMLPTAQARAEGNRWCAYFDPWTKNCEFNSQQACETAMSGTGKHCEPNPGFRPDTVKSGHHGRQ
jgi:Protein of unknown function (DUF3551)